MKKYLIVLFIISSTLFSNPLPDTLSTDFVSRVLKTNSEHQNKILSLFEEIQNHNDYLVNQYYANIDKVTGETVSYSVCEKIVSYGGDIQVVIRVENNLSYILDLTQSFFSVCELSDIIKINSLAQEKFLNRLSEQIQTLSEELKNNYEWFLSVEKMYDEEKNVRALKVVGNSKMLLKEMLEYYLIVQKEIASKQKI